MQKLEEYIPHFEKLEVKAAEIMKERERVEHILVYMKGFSGVLLKWDPVINYHPQFYPLWGVW